MSISKTIRKMEYSFDKKAQQFVLRHPLIGFAVVFAGMPILMLMLVCLGTMAIAFPVAWMFGVI